MRGIVSFGLTAVLLITGCGGDSQEGQNTAPVGKAEAELALQAATRLVDDYGRSLKKELMAAMSEGGPPNAISVCQMKAPELTREFAMDQVWSINRVSDRNRNPDNAVDSAQYEILARFADTGSVPVEHYDYWSKNNGELVYHYYRPIRTMQLCLNCHGDKATMSEEVLTILEKKYPDDQAVGYDVNELRGMFVVDIYWPRAKAHAEELVAAH